MWVCVRWLQWKRVYNCANGVSNGGGMGASGTRGEGGRERVCRYGNAEERGFRWKRTIL